MNKIEFVDTHTHIFVSEFDLDRNEVVERAVSAGVGRLCLPCIDVASVEPILGMCNNYPGICFPMIGLHPTDVTDNYKEQLQCMKRLLDENSNFIAVGEVGLDFYWDNTFRNEQLDAFETQIKWAAEADLPLAIHSRNAFDELYEIISGRGNEPLTGVFHCFSGSVDEAVKLLAFDGFILGVGGVLTYKKSTLPSVLATAVPLERIVIETDSPYLPPVPFRGKRNESAFVIEVAKSLADIYNVSLADVARITTENAERVFPKIKRL